MGFDWNDLIFGVGGSEVVDSGSSSDSSTTTQTLLDPTQQAYIAQMISRESELYPYLKDLVSNAGGNSQDVYAAAMGQLQSRFPGILDNLTRAVDVPAQEYAGAQLGLQSGGDIISSMLSPTISGMNQNAQNLQGMTSNLTDAVGNFQLSPVADQYLKNIRDQRIAGIQGDAKDLVGNAVADLNRRGMLSSSTSEGSMNAITKALEPAIASANADYYNSKLTMPGQVAQQQYGMNASTDAALANMLQSRFGIAQNVGQSQQNTAEQKMNLATNFGNTMKSGTGDIYNLLQNYGQSNAAAKSKMYDDPYQKYLSLWQPVATMGNTNQGGTSTTTQQTSPFQTIAAMAPYAAMAYMAA